jgi:hypothetical protein
LGGGGEIKQKNEKLENKNWKPIKKTVEKNNKKKKKNQLNLKKQQQKDPKQENEKPFVLWVVHNLFHFYYFNISSFFFSQHNLHLLGPTLAK